MEALQAVSAVLTATFLLGWVAYVTFWAHPEINRLARERDEARRGLRMWEERACDNAIARDQLRAQIHEMQDARDRQLGFAYEEGQHFGVDFARGIASRALSPKQYWRLEAAIEREVARAEDRADNVDVAAVLKRHRREALRGGEG